MKNKHFFLIGSIPFALSYWFFDSAVHYFGYGEFEFEIIPSEFNELWMRVMIFVLLVSFGIFADYHTNKMAKINAEKYDVYKAMLNANNHILNNFLQKMYIFKLEADDSKDFDKELLNHYNIIIQETKTAINNLQGLDAPSKSKIEAKYKPN